MTDQQRLTEALDGFDMVQAADILEHVAQTRDGLITGDQPNSFGMTSMTDDNVIRVPRIVRTGPCSALSIWPADAAGIVTTVFHSLQPAPMNLDALTDANIAEAAVMDNLADACAMVEKIAGLPEGSMVVQRMLAAQIDWCVFMEPADRESALRHWLTVERLFPALMHKEIIEVPG